MSKHVKYISSEHYGATLDILEKIHYYIPKFFYLLYFLKKYNGIKCNKFGQHNV